MVKESENNVHPENKVCEFDGARHCFKCRKTWHYNFEKQEWDQAPRTCVEVLSLEKRMSILEKEIASLLKERDSLRSRCERMEKALSEARSAANLGCRQCWDVASILDNALSALDAKEI